MIRSYRFKSLPMVPDPSGEKNKIAYDMENVRDHVMELGAAEFLLCRSWITSFFMALMAVLLAFALLYGLLAIGMKVDMGAGGTARIVFGAAAALSFLALFALLGAPAAVKRIKQDRVVKERGKGRWKIIDDAGWEMFVKMRNIEKERQKKEEAFRSVQ